MITSVDLLVTPAARQIMPEHVRAFFPADIDGYLFLVPMENGKVEVWKHIYADEHPWKERCDSDYFVEVLDAKAAANMIDAVAKWNEEGAKVEKKKAEELEGKKAQFQAWLDRLPESLSGFKRIDAELLDVYGNTIFHLGSPQLAFKTPDEIEATILELFADGYEVE